MRHIYARLFFLICAFGLLGCQLPITETPKSSNANLSALKVDGGTLSPVFVAETTTYTAVCSSDTVVITGTKADERANISAPVTLTALAVGVAQLATVTVTAQDGTAKTYTVLVTRGSSQKSITSFQFTMSTGSSIDEVQHTIRVKVPSGTVVTNLVPTITHTGDSISPASGVAGNFTNPVVYTVKALDGSTQQYTVTVTESVAETLEGKGQALGFAIDKVIVNGSGNFYFSSNTVFGTLTGGMGTSLKTFTNQVSDIQVEGNDAVLIAEGMAVWRYTPSTNTFQKIITQTANIKSFYILNGYILINSGSGRTSINLSTLVVAGTSSYVYSSKTFAVADAINRVFYFRDGVSPNDINFQDINPATGALGAEKDSMYHGDYPNVGPLKIRPDGSRLIQGNGYVFDTSDKIQLIGRLPYSFKDLVFYDGSIFMLSSSSQILRLQSEAPYGLQKNCGTLAGAPIQLLSWNGTLYAFYSGLGADTQTYLSSFTGSELGSNNPSVADPVIVSDGLTVYFPIKQTVADGNGNLFYAGATGFGKVNGSSQTVLKYFSQSITGLVLENTGSLLISEGFNIWRYTISSGQFAKIYTGTGKVINSICLVGNYLVVFAEGTVKSLNLSTLVIDSTYTGYYLGTDSPVFSSAGGAIFAATVGTSPRDLEYYVFNSVTGVFGTHYDSMYHGEYYFPAPFHLVPDGTKILTADGNIFSTLTPVTTKMVHIDNIPAANAFVDMFFKDASMVLLTNNKQLIKTSATTPYTMEKNIFSFTNTPTALAFGNSTAYATTTDVTNIWVSYIKTFTAADL